MECGPVRRCRGRRGAAPTCSSRSPLVWMPYRLFSISVMCWCVAEDGGAVDEFHAIYPTGLNVAARARQYLRTGDCFAPLAR